MGDQVLNDNQVAALLAVAGGYDNRRPGELNVHAWGEASERSHWSLDEAVEAMHQHYATSTDFAMPAHITKIIRATRRAVAELDHAEQLKAIPDGARKSFGHLYAGKLAESKRQSANQRDLVLAHPDLAAQLCQPPIGFKNADDWNGWVPPERDANGRVNDSPRALALGGLIGEAQHRARQASA
jgi:hypothetical protein